MFHLVKAGDCQLPQALRLLLAIYLQRPHNELEELSVTVSLYLCLLQIIELCVYNRIFGQFLVVFERVVLHALIQCFSHFLSSCKDNVS